MISLPILRGVPRHWTVHEAHSRTAQIALALLDAGIIAPDLRRPWTPAGVLQRGLQRWLAAQIRGTRWMQLHLHYAESSARAFREQVWIGERPDLAPPHYGLTSFLSLEMHFLPALFAGPALTRLEQAVPGLGQSVLWTLRQAGECGLPLLLPQDQLEMAAWTYWNGELDESEVREEWGAEYDGLTRAALEADVPGWALEPRSLSPRALRRIVGSGPSKPARQAAHAVLALRGMIDTHESAVHLLQPEAVPTTSWALWVRWSPQDPAVRIIDDWSQGIFESGEYSESFSEISIAPFDLDDFEGSAAARLEEFFAGLTPALRIAVAAEELLAAIGLDDAR